MSRVAYEHKHEFKIFGHKVFELNQTYFEHSAEKEVAYDSVFCEEIKKYIENNN